jgi:hypothetical protein
MAGGIPRSRKAAAIATPAPRRFVTGPRPTRSSRPPGTRTPWRSDGGQHRQHPAAIDISPDLGPPEAGIIPDGRQYSRSAVNAGRRDGDGSVIAGTGAALRLDGASLRSRPRKALAGKTAAHRHPRDAPSDACGRGSARPVAALSSGLTTDAGRAGGEAAALRTEV